MLDEGTVRCQELESLYRRYFSPPPVPSTQHFAQVSAYDLSIRTVITDSSRLRN